MTLRLPPGMARPHIPPNPDPARITDQMWEFACCVVSLEPDDFSNAGIYADKSGYHNTVTRNLQRWPGEYSTRLAADLNGVRDKARALDVKSKQAASGAKPEIMAKYGARMRAAAKARDPRVRHWREVLGQFDTDTPPEAIDFQSLGERQPDDTHEWHFHWSILAMFVALAEAYEGMLSVLDGEPPASWQAYKTGDEMPDLTTKVHVDNFTSDSRYPVRGEDQTLAGLWEGAYYYAILAKLNTDELRAAAAADEQRDTAVLAAVRALTVATGADPQPVLDAIEAVRTETHAGMVALQQQLAELQARNVKLATALAAAGVAFEAADD